MYYNSTVNRHELRIISGARMLLCLKITKHLY